VGWEFEYVVKGGSDDTRFDVGECVEYAGDGDRWERDPDAVASIRWVEQQWRYRASKFYFASLVAIEQGGEQYECLLFDRREQLDPGREYRDGEPWEQLFIWLSGDGT